MPPKERKHGKLLPALQSCHTLPLWLVTTFSEGEVCLVIVGQGTGTFDTRGCSKHF